MELKQQLFIIKGMLRDLSASKFNPDYAYENMNIRITAKENNSLLSVTNEKGNKEVNIVNEDGEPLLIEGVYLGYGILNNILILFTAQEGVDRIYRLFYNQSANLFKGGVLFEGDLNFNVLNPVETLCVFENEDIQKLYWVDGLNQPRVVNIAKSFDISKYVSTSFDFAQNIGLEETISVDKNLVSSGTFSPGTIQYAFSYHNIYAQETAIFYTSPLNYTSYKDRGGSPEDKVSNSFNIECFNLDDNFDSLRVYSIHRTTLDATPTVKRVVDLKIFHTYLKLLIDCEEGPEDQIVILSNNDLHLVNLKNNTELSLEDLYRPYTNDLENSTHQDYDIITYDDSRTYAIFDKTTNFIYKSNAHTEVIRYYEDGQFTKVVIQPKYPTSSTYVKKYLFETVKTAKTSKYTDNGTSGDIVDPTELLFKGSDNIVVGTMAHKDNTLFLGNIQLKLEIIPLELKNSLKENIVETLKFQQESTDIVTPDPKGYYPYENSLKHNSQTIKTFKYLEWYRFGVLFQHTSGRWSEAIYLEDLLNTIPIEVSYNSSEYIKTSQVKYTLSKVNASRLKDIGFIRARGIVSYPDVSDREVIAQGVLSPTLYNVLDRYDNTPFAISSWFSRPNASYDNVKNNTPVEIDAVKNGSLSEFRHNHPIPDNLKRNAEIQCISKPNSTPYAVDNTDSLLSDYISANGNNFYVDQSILTFHSPEIEFDDSIKTMDTSNLKMRIVGMVPITSSVSDVDIITSTSTEDKKGFGFYKESIGSENISKVGAKGLNSAIMWIDKLTNPIPSTKDRTYGFVVYPWHRNGSLNNAGIPELDEIRPAMLDKKKMSNLKYSYNSTYYKKADIWNAYESNSTLKTGISGVEIFNSNEIILSKINAPKNSTLKDITYYGNVDKVVTPSLGKYPIAVSSSKESYSKSKLFRADYVSSLTHSDVPRATEPCRIKYKSTPHAVLALNYSLENSLRILPTIEDTDGTTTWAVNLILNSKNEFYNIDEIIPRTDGLFYNIESAIAAIPEQDRSEDMILIFDTGTYGIKHWMFDTSVVILDESEGYAIGDTVWPTKEDYRFWTSIKADGSVGHAFWNVDTVVISQDVLKVPNLGHGYLWLAELYNDDIVNRFGGTSKEAIENNLWLPCGDPVLLSEDIDNEILYIEGDTFYGRYDCLKTYPSTLEDLNSVVDIVSFMVESRVNLDGRYDRNRGLLSNLTMNPTNFNKMNPVYSLNNNFFNYRSLNEERFLLNDFRNSVVWSKGKTLGELTDTWTNINLTSTIDLDGDKGPINALTRFKNEIMAFQDKGISRILFNSRVLLNASDGVPIEISNSYKVDGKVYIDEVLGCTNKWSIKNTKSGLYFNDDLSKGIYNFNGETFTDVTSKLGFNTYYNDISTLEKWNAGNFNNSITFYDNLNGDIYFVNKDKALSYSEKIGQFTSFYNYEETPLMFNIGDGSFAFKGNKIWKLFAGEYNSFFGVTKPYYVTVIANQEPTLDKTYSNLEFRADTWDDKVLLDNVTFDKLDIWNEYQHGEQVLYMTKNRQSPLKKKFRMWNVQLPRDKEHRRDRIRNPWAYLKLSMENPENYRTELHDIVINYFA